jgi:hypothetical protein
MGAPSETSPLKTPRQVTGGSRQEMRCTLFRFSLGKGKTPPDGIKERRQSALSGSTLPPDSRGTITGFNLLYVPLSPAWLLSDGLSSPPSWGRFFGRSTLIFVRVLSDRMLLKFESPRR